MWLGGWRDLRRLGDKWLQERLVKVEYVFEVIAAVVVGLAESSSFDEVEDNLSKISGLMDAPFGENGERHGAKLIERVFLDAVEQFFACDVTSVVGLVFPNVFYGDIECFN